MPKAPKQTMRTEPMTGTERRLAGDPPRVDAAMLDGTETDETPAATPEGAPGTNTPAEDAKPSRTPPKAAPKAKSAARSLFAPLAEQKEWLRYLLWGREGSGKTTAALSLSRGGRILVVNAEGGLKRRALKAHGVNVENVSLYPPDGEAITHAGLDEVFRRIKADLASDPDSWFGVVLDSATDIVTGMVGAAGDDRVRKARSRGTNIDEFDQWFTDRGDYGVASKMFRDLLRKFRTLDCHLVITALERRDVDADTSEVTYGPAVNAAIANDLAGYVDVIARATAPDGDKPFRALVRKDDRYRTKDRFGMLPAVLVNPSAARVLLYIDGALTEGTDEDQRSLPAAPTAVGRKTGKKAPAASGDAAA